MGTPLSCHGRNPPSPSRSALSFAPMLILVSSSPCVPFSLLTLPSWPSSGCPCYARCSVSFAVVSPCPHLFACYAPVLSSSRHSFTASFNPRFLTSFQVSAALSCLVVFGADAGVLAGRRFVPGPVSFVAVVAIISARRCRAYFARYRSRQRRRSRARCGSVFLDSLSPVSMAVTCAAMSGIIRVTHRSHLLASVVLRDPCPGSFASRVKRGPTLLPGNRLWGLCGRRLPQRRKTPHYGGAGTLDRRRKTPQQLTAFLRVTMVERERWVTGWLWTCGVDVANAGGSREPAAAAVSFMVVMGEVARGKRTVIGPVNGLSGCWVPCRRKKTVSNGSERNKNLSVRLAAIALGPPQSNESHEPSDCSDALAPLLSGARE